MKTAIRLFSEGLALANKMRANGEMYCDQFVSMIGLPCDFDRSNPNAKPYFFSSGQISKSWFSNLFKKTEHLRQGFSSLSMLAPYMESAVKDLQDIRKVIDRDLTFIQSRIDAKGNNAHSDEIDMRSRLLFTLAQYDEAIEKLNVWNSEFQELANHNNASIHESVNKDDNQNVTRVVNNTATSATPNIGIFSNATAGGGAASTADASLQDPNP